MGLAASQCRLLFVTSRQTDVSGKMQRISNDKMRLACDEDEVYSKFNRMYNTPKYTDLDGNDLNYNQIMGSSAAQNGLTTVISDYNGRVVLNSSMAGKLGLSGTGKGSDFNMNLETFIHNLENNSDIEQQIIDKINGVTPSGGDENTGGLSEDEITFNTWFNGLMNNYGNYVFDQSMQVYNILGTNIPEISLQDSSSNHELDDYNNGANGTKVNDFDYGTNNSPKININSSIVSGNSVALIACDGGASDDNVGLNDAKNNAAKIIEAGARAYGSAMGLTPDRYLHRVTAFTNNIKSLIQESVGVSATNNFGTPSKAKAKAYNDAQAGIIGHGHCLSNGGYDYYCMNVGEVLRRVAILIINDNQTLIEQIKDSNNYSYSNQPDHVSVPNGVVNSLPKKNNKGYTQFDYEVAVFKDLKGQSMYNQDPRPSCIPDQAGLNALLAEHPTGGLPISGSGSYSGATYSQEVINKANYYENLYNKLKTNGWVVPGDDVITTNLNQGLYYIQDGDNEREKISESDNYLEGKDKEMQDKAQAWYEHEINKINRKEKEMDTQMNKLQTEYTALTNDRNSIEQIIQKNIEKSFKFCQSG